MGKWAGRGLEEPLIFQFQNGETEAQANDLLKVTERACGQSTRWTQTSRLRFSNWAVKHFRTHEKGDKCEVWQTGSPLDGGGWRKMEKDGEISFFFFSGRTLQHAGSYFPDQGLNLHPLQWKREVLTTGPPGKSRRDLLRWLKLGLATQQHKRGGTLCW